MRKAEFEVPQNVMSEFTEEMINRNLTNTITGTTEDGEIVIEIHYDKDESSEVDKLETILEKIIEEQD